MKRNNRSCASEWFRARGSWFRIEGLGFREGFRDNGKEHGNYRGYRHDIGSILGLYNGLGAIRTEGLGVSCQFRVVLAVLTYSVPSIKI